MGAKNCAWLLTDCPLEESPCSGEFVPRKDGWDYKPNPDRDRIIRECPHACPEVCVGRKCNCTVIENCWRQP